MAANLNIILCACELAFRASLRSKDYFVLLKHK